MTDDQIRQQLSTSGWSSDDITRVQKPAKKFSFPFRRKKPTRAKEKQRKLFCWLASVSERRRGESVAVSFEKGSRKV
jgi:hypothetical protein